MAHDKKVADGKLTFILLRGLGQAFVTNDVPLDAVKSVLTDG
jgi:3-dehydroquinate synthase